MRTLLAILLLSFAAAAPLAAQSREVPYWASIKAEKLNMRAGPGRDFPIEWVYRREGMPLKVVRVHEGWRRVRDPDGAEGWVTANLLSVERWAMVVGEGLAAMRQEPADGARLRWKVEPGVVGKLGPCEGRWCKLEVDGRSGFVRQERLWGADDRR